MKIRIGIALLLAGIGALTAGLVTIGTRDHTQDSFRGVLEDNTAVVKLAALMELALADQRALLGNFLIDGDRHWLEVLEKRRAAFGEGFSKAGAMVKGDGEHQIVERIGTLYGEFTRLGERLVRLHQEGARDEARQLLHDVRDHVDQLHDEFVNLVAESERYVNTSKLDVRRRADGQESIAWAYIGLAGGLAALGVVLIIQAITGRLEKSESLATLGQMAGLVAHEVRNPLIAINMRIQSLQDELTSSYGREDVEVIRQEIERLKRIVQNFLDFARMREPKLRPLSINTVINQSLKVLKPMLEEQEIRVERRMPESVPNVRGDVDQLKQVLMNLLLNSIQVMPQGGTIRVSTEWVADWKDASGDVEVWLTDTGPGISEEIRNKIFEPFFTTKPLGSGLGLSVAKKIIELHRGVLAIENSSPNGTTWRIRLPATHEAVVPVKTTLKDLV